METTVPLLRFDGNLTQDGTYNYTWDSENRLIAVKLLLSRDEAGYREDLRASLTWVQRYFDPKSKQTADAVAQLKQLSAVSITFEMPNISESLEAVRGYKSRRERTPG